MPDQNQTTLTYDRPSQKKTWIAIAIAAVAGFEGLRQVAYLDPVGIPTICFGETAGVKLGQSKTIEQCKNLLASSLIEAEGTLNRCVGTKVADALPPPTKAAYVSFIYNVGPGVKGRKDGFCVLKSGYPSTMARLLKEGKLEASCRQFPSWAKAKGITLPGLTTRRGEEMALCLQGVEGSTIGKQTWNSNSLQFFLTGTPQDYWSSWRSLQVLYT